MIYVINKKRRIIIYLINLIGLISYPIYKLSRSGFIGKDKKMICHLENKEIKTIAINAIDRLGDMLFLSPALRAIKESYPDKKLLLITNKLGNSLYRNNPFIDEIIVADNPWIGQSLTSVKEFIKFFDAGYFKILREIRKKKIDLLIEVKGDFRNIICFDIWLSAKYLAGYAMSGFGWMLDREIKYKIGIHEIDAKLAIAKELGSSIETRELEYFLSEEEEEFAEKFFKKHDPDNSRLKIVMHIGGTWEPRLWPIGNFAEIAENFIREKNALIVLIGDNREKARIDKLISIVPQAIRLENESIERVAAVLKKADLFIGNDSGPMHLSRSVNTPLIGIFGPETTQRVGPENRGIALSRVFPCSPCGQVKCEISPNCVQSITVEEVRDATEKIISN